MSVSQPGPRRMDDALVPAYELRTLQEHNQSQAEIIEELNKRLRRANRHADAMTYGFIFVFSVFLFYLAFHLR